MSENLIARSVEVQNFKDFVSQVDNYDLISNHVVFRGQRRNGNLLPGIARKTPSLDTTEKEKKLLVEFLRIGQMKISADSRSELELMILAQHFGLHTRLLDWTSNPLAALWFACADASPGVVYVYALDAHDHLLTTTEAINPFDIARTQILRPNLGNERIAAQQGWFTLHKFSEHSKSFVPLERNADIGHKIDEFVIPADKREDILRSLDRFGINEATLMPDLQGLGRYLNWLHQT
jgi:hypothetical protein